MSSNVLTIKFYNGISNFKETSLPLIGTIDVRETCVQSSLNSQYLWVTLYLKENTNLRTIFISFSYVHKYIRFLIVNKTFLIIIFVGIK